MHLTKDCPFSIYVHEAYAASTFHTVTLRVKYYVAWLMFYALMFEKPNCKILFGDAKQSLQATLAELKQI